MALPSVPLARHLRALVHHRAARGPVLRGAVGHAAADPPPRTPRTGLCTGEHDLPDQPVAGSLGGRDPGGDPRCVPLAGPGRAVVLPVGRADHRVGPAPAIQRGSTGPAPAAHPSPGTLSLIFRQPAARTLVLFGWLAGFAVVPEGLALLYARTLGGGPLTVGLLDVPPCPPARWPGSWSSGGCPGPDERLKMIGALRLRSCAPLVVSLLRPPLPRPPLLFVLAGAGGAYQLAAARAFVRAMPNGQRGSGVRRSAIGTADSPGPGHPDRGSGCPLDEPADRSGGRRSAGRGRGGRALAVEWARHCTPPPPG